jgi:hypothetical protein
VGIGHPVDREMSQEMVDLIQKWFHEFGAWRPPRRSSAYR